MVSKKTKQKLMKHRICSVARVIACISFLVLTIIGVSSIVRAMSLETIANENGIPASWQTASLGNPDTITIPITYWDQRQDDCNDPNRQFEWSQCRLYAKGIVPNIVRNQLGVDGLPVPTYNNSTDAWNAYHDVFTANVIGNNPVQTTDNFYRWFHETYDENGKQLSKQYDREVVFHRVGNNSYEYGSKGTFPLDDVDFSKDDAATNEGHNFHFTAHMRIPMKISTDGTEEFWFSGDDDVWVFLNGQLVLDLGGLHMDTEGYFIIDKNGNVVSTINNVNSDQACRQSVSDPRLVGYDIYNSQLETKCPRTTVTKTINTNFKTGDVVNLDFFYAERSTTESNTRIHITNMNWPISADSDLDTTVAGRIENTNSNLIQFVSSISNRDPENPLNIERIAAYIEESNTSQNISGFLPLSSKTLYYSTNPDDNDSWLPVEISAPENSLNGFKLQTPLQLSKAGTTGDTLYFRYFGESSDLNGSMSSTISYYTSINGTAGVTYDSDIVHYETPVEYTVSVKYLYEDGTEAAPSYTEILPVGSTYEVFSPEIENYTPDITKISGTIQDSNIEYIVYYRHTPETPTPDETPKHTVTIKYVYEDGTTAAESYVEELEEGNNYSVISPSIDAYEPDQTKVEGIINTEDIEHVVVYRKKPADPIAPIDPTPEEPETPQPPTIPGSDIIDDDLIYLGPLGEVAFVPNTGIISDAVAAVFEVGFAEVILSQGFVMAMLLVFAGSFAVYFSLRKFLNLEMATATRNNSNMKRSKSYAKTKKSMPKSAKTMRNTKNTASSRTRKAISKPKK